MVAKGRQTHVTPRRLVRCSIGFLVPISVALCDRYRSHGHCSDDETACLFGHNRYGLSISSFPFELDQTIYLGKQGIVSAHADVFARMDARPVLPDQDASSPNNLTGEALHPETLARAVPAVS